MWDSLMVKDVSPSVPVPFCEVISSHHLQGVGLLS